ncbi:TPA: transcriptional regulator [Stenotrophomonas maltophilia]|uniref:transcriptional regulator n=1 Tax=Stenotrophomonas maltophilia TaxID=40324 RepID=UPI000C15FD15|nr:YdaS family helix-turn-helix protein [Stenotrophomonas maltophilia]HDS1307943.1 helix-turn-helix domain-containing protein [Stenotrophomonas maltophilia]HDS1312482.1 helix-turn-helix domain-containing protein [Stenotrophomonas maltophilia]HDS1317212.1 helix-turn-helix domain-containing protein [Stenotrophomonas maltophilia]HDS1442098.1 helix-turn-helix domain-containing protein [Stenotrophomonas maltophilia]HDS1516887.1 helix-turn-helix domain-containing protein [Stenotrophomonas maltophili
MDALDRAVKAAGGVTSLASHLGVRQSAVSNWRSRGRVPPAMAIPIESVTGVSRHDLCPEIFGPIAGLAPVTKRDLLAKLGLSNDAHLAVVLALPVERVAAWELDAAVPAFPSVLAVLGTEVVAPSSCVEADPDVGRIAPVDTA